MTFYDARAALHDAVAELWDEIVRELRLIQIVEAINRRLEAIERWRTRNS